MLHPWAPETAGFNFETARHVVGHGVVGGAANEAMGGKFQDGFVSAAASAAAADFGLLGNPNAKGAAAIASRTIRAGIVGGTASALGGGKFANGAWTAAFQHLLNAESKNIVKGVKEVTANYFIKQGHLTLSHPDSDYSVVAQMESGAWTKAPATDYRNNPDFQHVKSPDGSNGPAGPIPEGVYRIKVRPGGLKYGEPAYHLEPISGNAFKYNRGGPKKPFVIHTDTGIGCIVPGGTDTKDFNYLAHRNQYLKVTSFMNQFKPQGDHYGKLFVHKSL
jgi:hypothetical protein